MTNTPSVIRKAVTSAVWMFADSWLSMLVGLVSVFVLARLLGPEVFGVMALASAVMGAVSMFIGSALTESLKQRDTIEDGHIDAMFWLNFGLCSGFAIILYLASPLIGQWFSSPILAEILPYIILTGLISSLSAVPEALLERALDFKKLVLLDNLIDIPSVILTIALAVLGFGVWSLVISALVSATVGTLVLWRLAKWRPGFSATSQHVKDLSQFNRDTIATSGLAYLDDALPRFALGLWFGERAVGLFDIALNISGLLSGMIMGPFSELAMTVTARLQSDIAKVRILLDRVFELTTAILYPVTIGACILTPIGLPLLLGEQWLDAVLPVQIALLIGLRNATGDFNIAILRGVGDTKAPMAILIIGILALIAFAPFLLPYGAAGVVLLVLIRVLITWPISAYRVERAIEYHATRQFLIGWRSFVSALIMGFGVMALMAALPSDWSNIQSLIVLILVGIGLYIAVWMTLWRSLLISGLREAWKFCAGRLDEIETGMSETLAQVDEF